MTNPPRQWRKSSSSSSSGFNCIEVAEVGPEIVVRNSNRIGDGTLAFSRTGLAAFVAACKAGEFDDLT